MLECACVRVRACVSVQVCRRLVLPPHLSADRYQLSAYRYQLSASLPDS